MNAESFPHSMSCERPGDVETCDVLGRTVPRIWTPSKVELTPETSYGYDVIDFASRVLEKPLDPWQQWLVIHLGELLPDGRPRFRQVLVLVARQQGKTYLCRVLTLYWMFVERHPVILGMSSGRPYAKAQWQAVCREATSNKWLKDEVPSNGIRLTISEECLTCVDPSDSDLRSQYVFAATNRRAGRSLTIDRVIADELREHAKWDAWNAAKNAMNARRNAQLIAITNQGDDESVVLDALRDPAIEYAETGIGDPRLGIFEWSAPAGSCPTDLEALAYACPDLGGRTDPDALLGDALRAQKAGGVELASFKTEVMCMRVDLLDPAIDPECWKAAKGIVDLSEYRDRVALCLDVSLDGMHASLIAAADVSGIVHLDVVAAWSGWGCTKEVRQDLPGHVARVRPRVVGWFPAGPAAVLTADMLARPRSGWPPRRVELMELKAETPAVCMALAELVISGQVRQPGDPMLDAQIASTQRLGRGDRWVYQRRGAHAIDGSYAAAGAAHLARTLPPPRSPLVVC
jgi:hypothetical protein